VAKRILFPVSNTSSSRMLATGWPKSRSRSKASERRLLERCDGGL